MVYLVWDKDNKSNKVEIRDKDNKDRNIKLNLGIGFQF